MKRGIVFWLAILFIVAVAACGLSRLLVRLSPAVKPPPLAEKSQPSVPKVDQGLPVEITGLVRSSGLEPEEKLKLGLKYSAYQVTDFNKEVKVENLQFFGAFIEDNDPRWESLLGKCVQVNGYISEKMKSLLNSKLEVNQQYTYQRFAFVPQSFSTLPTESCLKNKETTSDRSEEGLEELEKFQGVLERSGRRPAPDIGYDYQLRLAKPYKNPFDSSGLDLEIDTLIVVPSSGQIQKELEENLGKKVELEGVMTWGYAESSYLDVRQVKLLH